MKQTRKRGEEGIALFLSLIVLVAMGLVLTALFARAGNQANQVDIYVDFQDTMEGMESALSLARNELQDLEDGFIGVDPGFDFSTGQPDFGDTGVTPLQIPAMPQVDFFAYSINWFTDGIDNNGDGNVDDPEEENYFAVYAFGKTNDTERQIEVILNGGNVNIWDNAIFGGSGQTGNLINGNVSIHGSVHLLGDALGAGGVAVEAIDLSGTSLIHNNYDGLDGNSNNLRQRVPAPPTTDVNGNDVETLKAKLRVKQGLVGLSGNSEIGQPNDDANLLKEQMDGVFVSDGWTGNGLDANGDPINVFSDNGFNEDYDLGGAVPFPTYDDDGGIDHLAYFLEGSDEGGGTDWFVKSGDITIQANQNYFWNATQGIELTGGTVPDRAALKVLVDAGVATQFVWFDAASNHMIINGRIAIDGNLTFNRGAGNDKTINYSGRGTFLTYDKNNDGNGGDASIQTDLVTTNIDFTTFQPTNTVLSFPNNNLLGVMAGDDMIIGTNSQITVMGGFYAQDQIAVDKQTTIMGTIVGDFFNMGTNVPDIYQVPELKDAWGDLRMIGANPVNVFIPISWREVGVV